jgi:hypothetical protein
MIANPADSPFDFAQGRLSTPLRSGRGDEFIDYFRGRAHLSAQVDESDFGDGLAEEVGAKTLEFFYGVGGVEGEF